jgi:hypothetical protein
MAIVRLSNTGVVGTTNSQVTVNGVDYITEVTIEEAAGTVVRAKDGAGDVKAVLVGKTLKTLQASGYGSIDTPPDMSAAGGIAVAGSQNFSGKMTSFGIERSAEDFARYSITAEAK